MKVIHVIDRLDVGGAEQVFLTITSLLHAKGMPIAVLLFNNDGALTHSLDATIKLYCLNRTNKYAPGTLLKAHTICRQFDIVHVHMRHCYSYISLARFLFNGKYKIILHDHYGNIEIDKAVPFKIQLFKPKYYIGVSSQLQQWAYQALGVNKQNTFLLRNTVLNNNNKITLSAHGTMPRVLLISNFRRIKNIEFAVQLVNQLNWNLTIYGQAVDVAYYQSIVALTSNLDNISIVTNISSFEEIAESYDIAIHCAFSESGPLVLMEYMKSALPFIAYKTGEVADTVYNEFPILFMHSFDIDKWTERIQEIKDANIGLELKAAFQKHFSADKYVEDCLRIYQHVHS